MQELVDWDLYMEKILKLYVKNFAYFWFEV